MAQLPRVELTETAERDLDEIFVWIAEDSSVARARIIVTRIYLAIERVAQFPGIGRVRLGLPGTPQEYPITPWLMFYRASETGEGITVLRVIDGRRDLPLRYNE